MKLECLNSYAKLIRNSFDEIDRLLSVDNINLLSEFGIEYFKQERNQCESEIIENLRISDYNIVKKILYNKLEYLTVYFEDRYQTIVHEAEYNCNEESILSLYSFVYDEVQYIKGLFDENISWLSELYHRAKYWKTLDQFDSTSTNETVFWGINEIDENTSNPKRFNVERNDMSPSISERVDRGNIIEQFTGLFKPECKQFLDDFIQTLELEGIIENDIFTGRPDKNYLAKTVAFWIDTQIMLVGKGKISSILRIVYLRFGWITYEKTEDAKSDRCVSMRNLRKTAENGITPEDKDEFLNLIKNNKK